MADGAIDRLVRSCTRCNQKKIRCSKNLPCDACVKTRSECVFPAPGRAPRRRKRPLKAELVSRLKNLEQQVRDLNGETSQHGANPIIGPTPGLNEQGKLLMGRRESRYVTHDALLTVSMARREIEEPTDLDEALGDSPESPEARHQPDGFIFGYSSLANSLEPYHPSLPQGQILQAAFEANVAPVSMIFHKPSLHKLLSRASTDPTSLDRPSEAIVFAVYFAAITAKDPKDTQQSLGQDRGTQLDHYRFATQQALARAGFLHSSRDLAVLQAAVLFLTCLRGPRDADFVWVMTAAVHRVAQGLGLHRDGTYFGLTPFETEMRRRLWWSIYLLDSSSSEFHAIGNLINEGGYDTKLPLNIADEDISPESIEIPVERTGFTEIGFCLVRCEMTVLYRRVFQHQKGQKNTDHHQNLDPELGSDLDTLHGRLDALESIHRRLREKYLRFCDVSVPIQWVAATVIRLALARTWLLAHLSPASSPSTSTNKPPVPMPMQVDSDDEPGRRDQLFQTAIEVVQFAFLLETDARTTRWAWLFEGYPQWHAVVFVLSELCARSPSPEMEMAWAVVDKAVERWVKRGVQRGGITLKVIFDLMAQAAGRHGRSWSAPDI